MAFSENLSYLRKKSELSQEQLAEQLGFPGRQFQVGGRRILSRNG